MLVTLSLFVYQFRTPILQIVLFRESIDLKILQTQSTLFRYSPTISGLFKQFSFDYWWVHYTAPQILSILPIIEGVRAMNLQATLLFVDFSIVFDSVHRGKMDQILFANGLPKENVTTVIFSSADSCRNIHIYTGYILTQWITDARNDKDAGRLL